MTEALLLVAAFLLVAFGGLMAAFEAALGVTSRTDLLELGVSGRNARALRASPTTPTRTSRLSRSSASSPRRPPRCSSPPLSC